MTGRARWRRIVQEDRGETLVEFSISAFVLFMAMLGILDFSRALYTYHFVSYAAQEGTRYAMVRGADWTPSCASASSYGCQASAANITSYVRSLSPPGVVAGNIGVTPTWPQLNVDGASTGCNTIPKENSQGCLVKVQVTYSFHFMMPFIPQSALTMSATSEKVIAY
ncbi:MAG: TadE/TadG family type IV pilus assembly protein [Terracidiphilus sp.]|jgi:Flp pilus assembly protein TadG